MSDLSPNAHQSGRSPMETKKMFGVSPALASRLLSGMMFIDAWQPDRCETHSSAIFEPLRQVPISGLTVRHLRRGSQVFGKMTS